MPRTPPDDRSISGRRRRGGRVARTLLGLERATLRLEDLIRDGEPEPRTIFADVVALGPGRVLTIDVLDAQLVAKSDAGRSVYFETTLGVNAGCRICHSLEPGEVRVGPTFAGIAATAANRVPGMSAEEYLRQSLLDPDAHVVDGFPAGQMVPNYLDLLSDEDIDNLVAFLLTLR